MRVDRQKLAAALIVPLLLAAVAELAAVTLDLAPTATSPLVVWNPRRDVELNTDEGEFRAHHAWLWEPRPGALVHGDPINDHAMRSPPVPEPAPGRLRIAVLGDSTTYGFGFREREAWGRSLETGLRSFGVEVDVLNFGVIGFTLEQGFRMYVGKVRELRPDVVVAAFGAVNDHFMEPATDRAKIELLSHPLHRTRRFFERYAVFRLLARGLEGETRSRQVSEDDLTPRVPIDEFRRRLVDLDRAVAEDGARLVLVSPPRRRDGEAHTEGLLQYTGAIREVAAREGILLAPVRDAFRAADRAALGERWDEPPVARTSRLYIDQWHPSVPGHRLYAGVVGRTLLEAGLLPALEGRPDVMKLLDGAGDGAAGEPGDAADAGGGGG